MIIELNSFLIVFNSICWNTANYKIADGDISGMTAKQAKTTVAKYITNLKISRAKKEELAKMFGFTVKLGKIYIN